MIGAVIVAVLAALPIVMLPDLGRLGVRLAKVAERLWLPDDVILGWADNAYSAYEDAVDSRRSHVYVLLSSLMLLIVTGPYIGIKTQARRRRADLVATTAMSVVALAPLVMLVLGGSTPIVDVARLKDSVKGTEELLDEERSYNAGRTNVTDQGLIAGLNDIDDMSQGEFAMWVADTFPEEDADAISDPILELTPAEWQARRVKFASVVDRINAEFDSVTEDESTGKELEIMLQEEVDNSHQWLSASLWYHGAAVNFAIFGLLAAAALGAPTGAAHRARLRVGLLGLLGGLCAMPLLFRIFGASLADGLQLSSLVLWPLLAALAGLAIGLSRMTEALRSLASIRTA